MNHNLLVYSSLILSMANPIFAQTNTIEEVIITAQKREQALQDVGISVTAFNENSIKELQFGGQVDLAEQIPNTQVNYGFGQPSFNVRGIGANELSANFGTPVAIHIDEIYMSKSFMTTLGIFDMKRIEVLKGPQGTLFGRNTTGGSVNFVSNKPTEEFDAGVKLSYGNYETIRTDLHISGSLSDKLQGRLSGFYHKAHEGQYFNAFDGSDTGAVDQAALRIQLAYAPNMDLDVAAGFHWGRDRSELSPYEGVGAIDSDILPIRNAEALAALIATGNVVDVRQFPGDFCSGYLDGTATPATANCVDYFGFNEGDNDPRTVNQNMPPKTDNTSVGGFLRFDLDMDSSTLISITAVEYFERDAQEDSNGNPTMDSDVLWYNEITQFTQELRVTSSDDGVWDYIIGAFYQHDDFENVSTLLGQDNPLVALGGFTASTDFTQQSHAAGLFFHNDVEVHEKVSLIAGARFGWEQTAIKGGTYLLPFVPGLFPPPEFSGDEDTLTNPLLTLSFRDSRRTDTNVSFKLGLEWTPTNDMLVYGNVQTGFRSGGYNGVFAFTQDSFTTFDPEKITAFEVGFKSTFMESTLQINGSAFFYQYEDLQVNSDIPGTRAPATLNASEGEYYGVELDVWWKPTSALDLKAGFGYLSSEYTGDLLITGINFKGNTPINAPEFNFNGLMRYEQPISDNINLVLSSDLSWRDDQYLEVTNTPLSRIDDYWLFNARAALSYGDSWELAVWGKNLGDEEYITYVNDLGAAIGAQLNIYGPPRTYGISLEYIF